MRRMNISRDSPDAASTSDHVPDHDSALGTEFEVFLSFGRPDTCDSFTDSFYHALVGAGLRVFKGDEEIREGEKIAGGSLHAIECSKVYVPIFSKSYAASAWCLREFTQMVECASKATDKVILPIFYDVKTDDVKLEDDDMHKSLYLDDLEKHKEKFGQDDVEEWEKALIEVGRIDGWDLQEKDHGEIIRSVVLEVWTRLMGETMPLPDQLVGIHDHVQDFMKLLQKGSPYLVIHGMGGVGKTTLARAVFNRIFNQFDVRCFLSDVRESALSGRIMDLQIQLLSELCPVKPLDLHSSVDAGIMLIRRRFRDKKVFLVLDDVDTWDQLSGLAGEKDWFGPESKIIITTRDINFLSIKKKDKGTSFQAHSREYEFYEMAEMDSSHSLQLFYRRASENDSPMPDFADIARKISCKTGGLPLAREALGFDFRCRSLSIREDTLDSSDHEKPFVVDKLRMNYDKLANDAKAIFLDIACFFVGQSKHLASYMWSATECDPYSGLHVLTKMSLIKILENGTLWMNVHLRDFGRDIIAHEGLYDPGKRSRLWDSRIALEVIRTQKLKPNVQALRLTELFEEDTFTSKEFSRMPNLRFLEFGGNLVGNFKNLFCKLTWFSWSNCPSEFKATDLCLRKLVVLILSGSNITEDWAGWGPCLVSKDLKVIQITRCPNLRRTPDMSKCSKLERLVLQGGETSLVANGSLSKLVVYGF